MTMMPPDIAEIAEEEATRGPGTRHRGDARVATGFLAPSMLGLLAFTAFPIVASLVIGFYDGRVIGHHVFPGLKNSQALIESKESPPPLLNPAVLVVLSLPLNIIVSLGLAVWIS